MKQLNTTFRISILVIAIAVGFFSTVAYAGNDAWSVAGQPDGGLVLKTVVNPVTSSTLYACANAGLFKSTDSGVTWSLALPLLNQADDAAIAPENPDTLYVASNDIYKTTNGGSTWTQVDNGIGMVEGGLQQDGISYVSVDPVNDGTAYAVGLNTGLYKTINGGQSWSTINTGLTSLISSNAVFGEIAVDPVNPQVLYVTVLIQNSSNSSEGIYTSTNGGGQWTASITNVLATDVVVDPNNDAHVLAVINYQVYASSNSGGTWAPLASSPSGVQLLRINPKNSQNLIASGGGAIYFSTDGGTSWTLGASNASFYIEDIAIDPVTPANLYVSTSAFGLYKSTDGGQTITESDVGLHAVAGINHMVMGNDGAIYISSTLSGVFKSTNLGGDWSAVNNGMTNAITGIDVYALLEDPQTPTTLYVGTVEGLFKTTDGGIDWTLLNNGKTDPYTFSVAIDPENTNTVYTGTQTGGIFKSINAGSTWQSTSGGLPTDSIISLAVDPADSNVVYAGTYSHGLYRSTDAGATWSADNSGMAVTTGIWAIATDSTNAQNIYLSVANQDIYKSTDGGNTWSNASNGMMAGNIFQGLIVDPTRTTTLYAAPTGIGQNVYVSTDAGAHWQSITPFGLATSPIPVMVTATVVDPQNPENLYGAASDGQVYVFSSLAPTAKAGSEITSADASISAQLFGDLSGFTGEYNFVIATAPAHGTVTINDATSGAFTYTPANGFSGSDSFSFTVAAAGAVSAPATESISVNASPQSPPSSGGSGGGGGALSLWTLLLLVGLAARRRNSQEFLLKDVSFRQLRLHLRICAQICATLIVVV